MINLKLKAVNSMCYDGDRSGDRVVLSVPFGASTASRGPCPKGGRGVRFLTELSTEC